MNDVIEDVEGWVGRGHRVALATVVGVKRPAPRPPGLRNGRAGGRLSQADGRIHEVGT